ncbi:MAG: sugar transferase [Synergistales bacterium]|nr:sugar transferase [Synergistales bacterium]
MTKSTRFLRTIKRTLFLVDCLVYLLAVVWITGHILHTVPLALQYGLFWITLLLGLYAFRAFDLSRDCAMSELLVRVLTGSLFGEIAGGLFLLLVTASVRVNRGDLLLVGFVVMLFVAVTHGTALLLVRTRKPPIEQTLVIGTNEKLEPLFFEMSQKHPGLLETKTVIEDTAEAVNSALETNPGYDLIIIATPEIDRNLSFLLHNLQGRGYQVVFLPQLVEELLKRIPLPLLDVFSSYYIPKLQCARPTQAQRTFDLVVSTIVLVLLSPVLLLGALAVLLEAGRPVFFKQERIGYQGKPVELHKLRTMNGSNRGKKARFADDEQHRITKSGAILRKFRFDEIPQLWDAICGRMSLVGPRPEQIDFVDEYNQAIPYYWLRHNLKVGITGWAQIHYPYSATVEDTKKKLEYDLYYIKSRSVLLDLQIILKTMEVMLRSRGAK